MSLSEFKRILVKNIALKNEIGHNQNVVTEQEAAPGKRRRKNDMLKIKNAVLMAGWRDMKRNWLRYRERFRLGTLFKTFLTSKTNTSDTKVDHRENYTQVHI